MQKHASGETSGKGLKEYNSRADHAHKTAENLAHG
jgi:hypothetical protein